MVSINFTIFVQLALFLLFLWGMQKWVLGPMLQAMDAREEAIDANKAAAQEDTQTAEALEAEYARSMAHARRDSANILREAQATAMQRRNERIRQRRDEVDAIVAQHGAEAAKLVEAERPAFDSLVPKIADAMLARLKTEESAS